VITGTSVEDAGVCAMQRAAWSGWSALPQVLLITNGQWLHICCDGMPAAPRWSFWQGRLVKFLTFDTPGTTTRFSSLIKSRSTRTRIAALIHFDFIDNRDRRLIEVLHRKGKPAVMGTLGEFITRFAKVGQGVQRWPRMWTNCGQR
jgi:hypothetical protein